MMTRVTKLLVGKDMDRTASIVNIYAATPQPANGEILVLDNKKVPLAAGATISDSDIIYICQGTSITYNYTNDAGTTVTAARKLKFSDPIEGAKIKGYRAVAFDPKTEKSISFAAITAPLTTGTEWTLKVVYKDINAKRGQFTKTYRFIATTTTSANVYNGIRAAVRADAGARISVNADSTAALVITGLEIPECTTGVTDIDKFSMVDFDAFLTYVDSSDNHQLATGGGTKTATAVEYGSGNWEQVRDLEKDQLGYEGILDQRSFPQVSHALSTVVSTEYNIIVIEHDKSYLSPDNQYVKQTPMTTLVALPVGALQTTDILGVLNPWMASANFTAITF